MTIDHLNVRDRLDDAVGDSMATWRTGGHYTSASYDKEELKKLRLTREQFAEIGENIVIRLLAVNGLID